MNIKRTLIAICIAASTLSPVFWGVTFAGAPQVKTQAPGYYRTFVGDFEVTALSDGTINLNVDELLKGISKKDIKKALAYHHLSLPVETSVTGYLVNTGSKLVLIDAGVGGGNGPTLGKLVSSLKAAGYQPEQVDEVLITHLHFDHVGGIAAAGARVFPNAVVRAEQHDADFWLSADNMAKAPEGFKGFFEMAQKAIKPYAEAGKFKPFSGNTELVPGIRAVVTHAHTPGHSTYVVESKGQRLVILGDLIHVGAVQFDKPKVAITFDSDSKNAIKQRLQTFDRIARDGDLAAGAHLSFPGLGHLRKQGSGYVWLPVNYQGQPGGVPQ